MGLAMPQSTSQVKSRPDSIQDVQFRLQTLQKTLSSAPIQSDVLTALNKTINSFLAFAKDDKTAATDSQIGILAQQFSTLMALFQKSDPQTYDSVSSILKGTSLDSSPKINSSGTAQPMSVSDTRASLLTKAGVDTSKLEGIEKKIYQILIGGIENLGELSSILDIVGNNSLLLPMAILNEITESIKDFALSEASKATSLPDLQNKMSGIASVLREKGDAMVALNLDVTDVLLNPEVQQMIRKNFGDNVSIDGSGKITKTGDDDKTKSASVPQSTGVDPTSVLFPDQALKKQDSDAKEAMLRERLGAFNIPSKASESKASSSASDHSSDKIGSLSKPSVPKLSALKAEDPFATPSTDAVEKEQAPTSLVNSIQPSSSPELSHTAHDILQRLTEAKTEKELKNILKDMFNKKTPSTEKEFKALIRSPQVKDLLKPGRFKDSRVNQTPKIKTESPRIMPTQGSATASKPLKRGNSPSVQRTEDSEDSPSSLEKDPTLMGSALEALLGKDEKPWAPRPRDNSPSKPEQSTLINLRKVGDTFFRGSQVSDSDFKGILQNNPAQLADFLETMAQSMAQKIIGGTFAK